MLSKILTGTAGSAVPHWNWPVAAGQAQTRAAIPGPGNDAGGQAARDARRIAELEQQIEKRARESREAGLREGETAGRVRAAAEMQPVLDKLALGIQEIAALRPQLRREATAELVQLSLRIARRILHRELTVAPEALWGLVKAALEKLEARELHRMRVAPSDAATLRKFIEQMGLPQRVELVEDASLGPGSVLIDSSRGVLDASVDTQLAEIERGFADVVRSGS